MTTNPPHHSNPHQPPSAPHLPLSAAKPCRRGGPRPGAGAPRGNLNALKHGRRSRQFAELGALLAANPKTRDALLALAQRHNLKQRKATEVAAEILSRLYRHAQDIARGVPSRGPFVKYARLNAQSTVDERRTINPEPAGDAGFTHAAPPEQKKRTPHNQPPDTKAPE